MDIGEADKLVKELAVGFEALQDEYQKLHGRHQALERKLATAREQYNELVKLCGSGAVTTPPLSLASSPAQQRDRQADPASVADILDRNTSDTSKEVASKVRSASIAVTSLKSGLLWMKDARDGVKIWSGPSADRSEAASRMMPSISESPLEQDFTVEGKPSKLGCPFASMAGKKLSSHAASVLSRYNHGSTVGAGSASLSSSVSRVNGRESLAKKNGRRANSFADPIKAEICGLSDHEAEPAQQNVDADKGLDAETHPHPGDANANTNADTSVCPIRFLDQHSPEEVATYFERHKHELPRSHELCVKRYQSNEQQIRELDAKYGTLVSMIQGLGAKHRDFLPKDVPDEVEGGEAQGDDDDDDDDDEKVLKWASSVSAQAADGKGGPDEQDVEVEERQPHFERPLRDIRVGESPSRPWGIHVPAEYSGQEDEVGKSSSPAPLVPHEAQVRKDGGTGPKKCPFGSSSYEKNVSASNDAKRPREARDRPQATFIAADAVPTAAAVDDGNAEAFARMGSRGSDKGSRLVFTGPVFIGYSAQDAAQILQESGLGTRGNV